MLYGGFCFSKDNQYLPILNNSMAQKNTATPYGIAVHISEKRDTLISRASQYRSDPK